MHKHLLENISIIIMALCLVAFPGNPAVAGEPERASTDLDLVLIGTVLNDPGNSMAIIQVGDTGEQALYRLDDVVEGGRVTKILSDSITLTFAETEVELDLTGGATAAATTSAAGGVQPPLPQTPHGFWRVERESLDRLSREPELIKHVTSLGAEGFRIDKVQADDVFDKLGLQQGDVILSINAEVPGSGNSMKQAIAQMGMSEPLLRLEIERQGQLDVRYYEFDLPSSTLDN